MLKRIVLSTGFKGKGWKKRKWGRRMSKNKN
jgi:hypothetical protein